MKDDADKLLIVVSQVKEEGEEIAGELPPTLFDVPEDDRIAFPHPLHYRLRVAAVGPNVLIQGEVSTLLRCRCDRCLTYFDCEQVEPGAVHFIEPPLPEVIDLTDAVREDILIALPQKLICASACKGLCPTCGQNLNVRPCTCVPAADTKAFWGPLDGLKL